MIIYEVVNSDKDVLFRTKDKVKADTFAKLSNKYHSNYFDNVRVVSFDTNKIDSKADKYLDGFTFKVLVTICNGKVVDKSVVWINDAWIDTANTVNVLSDRTFLFFDINLTITDDLIFTYYSKALKEREKLETKIFNRRTDYVAVNS